MKIISLNTWGGRAGKDKLLSFFNKYKDDVDIFCLQEISTAPYDDPETANLEIMMYGLQEISTLLSDFIAYFRPHYGDNYGLLMLVKKHIEVKVEGEVFVHKYKGYIPGDDVGHHARNIQFITTELKELPLTVINFHGLWNGQGKNDSDDRLDQSKKIKEFIETLQGNILLCGDFNLLPDTQSIKILEDIGLRNLIKENNITSTRTSYYIKPEKFADYVFVSQNIKVEIFKVLSDKVSDHSALYLEFN